LLHHWKHEKISWLWLRYGFAWLKMLRRQIFSRADTLLIEGCAEWEISLTAELEKYRAYREVRKSPRHYQKFGLVKLSP